MSFSQAGTLAAAGTSTYALMHALGRQFSLGLLSRLSLFAQFDYSWCHSALLISAIAPY